MELSAEFDIVIGLTGLKSSGKDEVCRRLADHGFASRACSDEIIDEARRRGIASPTFEQKIEIGNWGRASGDGAFWAKRVLETLHQRGDKHVIVNGLRHPDEVAGLKQMLGDRLVLVGVVAPTPLRAERILKRRRAGDPKDMTEFLRLDDADRGIGQPASGQQVDRTLALVPYGNVYNNAGSLEDYYAWCDALAARLLG